VKGGEKVAKGQSLANLDAREIDTQISQLKANRNRAATRVEQAQRVLSMYRKTVPKDLSRARFDAEAALSSYNDAVTNAQRIKKLFAEKLVSTKDNDAATLAVKLTKAKLNDAQAVVVQAQANMQKINVAEGGLKDASAAVAATDPAIEQALVQKSYANLCAPFAGIIFTKAIELGEMVTPNKEVFVLSDTSVMDIKVYVHEETLGKIMASRCGLYSTP